MAKKKNRRVQLASLLIAGEGAHDKAFIEHLKDIYDHRATGQTVKIISADGGSPRDIIKSEVKYKHAEYDRKYVLMDSDVTISAQDRAFAKKHNLIIIESTPHCLEGMLLDALNKRVPSNSPACKQVLHPMLTGHPADKASYRDLFPKAMIDGSTKKQLIKLRRLLENKN